MAARTLGIRRAREAAAPLREVALGGPDPFLSAAALRSLVAIEGIDPLRLLLTELAERGPLLLATAASEALRQAPPARPGSPIAEGLAGPAALIDIDVHRGDEARPRPRRRR